MAAAEPTTAEHTTVQAGFEQALAAIDTARTQPRARPAPRGGEGPGHPGPRVGRPGPPPRLPGPGPGPNKSERALRTPVVGRKNYYGSHAEWSAHLAASVWTITATAERHHREPLAYLTSYLDACASAGGKAPEGQALHQFLPWIPGPAGSRDHDPPEII
jgi:transposase